MNAESKSRQQQKHATRARIMTVARAHFEREGYKGASVRAIASDAGVAPGTVLLHFEDKLGLLHASLHDELEVAIERSLSAPSRGRIVHRLCLVIQPFFEHYAARPALSRTLLRESLLAESPWKERFAAQLLRVSAHLGVLVQDAKDKGQLSAETPVEAFLCALFSFYYFALIGWVQGMVADPMPLFRQLLTQHVRGCEQTAGSRGAR